MSGEQEVVSVEICGPSLLREAFSAALSGAGFLVGGQDAPVVAVLLDGLPESCSPVAASNARQSCVLVTRGVQDELVAASRAGLQVFVSVEDEPEVLREAIRSAARAQAYCSPLLLPRLLQALRESPLTRHESDSYHSDALDLILSEREREIVALVAVGRSNDQVAERLFISVATVKFHLGNVYRKLGISRRGELVTVLPTMQASR